MSKNKVKIQAALTKAMNETLENMAFEQALLVEEPHEADQLETDRIWAKLDLIDPLEGVLYLIVCKDCAANLAENILGIPEDENGFSSEMISDTVAELINTIAGRMVRTLVPEDYEFEIGLPETGIGEFLKDKEEFLTVYFETAGRTVEAGLLGEKLSEYEIKNSGEEG